MDKFKTNQATRSFLQKLINFLDKKDIAYTLDNELETIEFDLTELSSENQQKVETNLKRITEQLTPKQKQLTKHLRPLVESILNEVGDQNTINYVTKELAVIDLQNQYAPTVVFKSGGEQTKHISLSTDSIPVIIQWLKKAYKEREKVEKKSTNV